MSNLSSNFEATDIKFTTIEGTEVARCYSSLEREVYAIRNSVAMTDMSYLCALRLKGKHHHQLLNRILPRTLSLRNNKVFQSLFILDGSWHYADIYVLKETEGYLLLVKGIDKEGLVEWIKEYLEPGEEIDLTILNESHSLIALNGPFAWELLSELVDPEIISLPYLSFYYPDIDQILIRSGETGEFGYLLISPDEDARQVWNQAMEQGLSYGLELAGTEALDYCALENNFFNVYKEGSIGANPKELQLQWRLTYGKHFNQMDAIKKMRSDPLQRRMVAIWSEGELFEEEAIYFGSEKIGQVVNAHQYLSGAGYIGLAMIKREYSESGVKGDYKTSGGVIHTISPPFINNRSLMVNPQIHSYQDQDEIQFLELNALRGS